MEVKPITDLKYRKVKCRMAVNKEFNLNRQQIVKVKQRVEEYEIKNRLPLLLLFFAFFLASAEEKMQKK